MGAGSVCRDSGSDSENTQYDKSFCSFLLPGIMIRIKLRQRLAKPYQVEMIKAKGCQKFIPNKIYNKNKKLKKHTENRPCALLPTPIRKYT